MIGLGYITTRAEIPQVLTRYLTGRAEVHCFPPYPRDEWPELVVVEDPMWHEGHYCSVGAIWHRYFVANFPSHRFLIAGYSAITHTNYLDLLALPDDWEAHLEAALTCQSNWQLPPTDGLQLLDKLQRFLAGHGDQSVVTITGRLKMTVAVAQREYRQMQTPYEEIYRALIRPANLIEKWAEWRSRWDFYLPLFSILPFRTHLEELLPCFTVLENWIATDCKEPEPLENGSLMRALEAIQQTLQLIEEIYVGQELQITDR